MNTANQESTDRPERLRPAGTADSKLDHLERMVNHVTRADAQGMASQLDHEYWEKRIRALMGTHDLIATQRHRVIKLLDRLEREALFRLRTRTAA
jgi:hypothetical protein